MDSTETYSGDAEQWSDAEKDSFLLGLYMFQKNFVQVRRIVESKKMNTILSYYYGKFYPSPEYKRWSDHRKRKSKSYVPDKRIFCGLTEQEMLSRILGSVSEALQDAVLEVSKQFNDKEISLPDYVASLKSMVGTSQLMEVFRIGKGKTHTSLTTTEIMKILNADHRMSKARSNDLFWEVVWPLLLAKGWSLEEGTKFICLAPDANSLSCKKLVKGKQFFDSVADVLSKVAKESGLIELDVEATNGDKSLEQEEGVHIDGDHHGYLQPPIPNQNANVMQCTIVDTSLPGGSVRELRELPLEVEQLFQQKFHRENVEVAPSSNNIHPLESSSGTEHKLLIDLNEPYGTPESSHGAEPEVLIDLNEPDIVPESSGGAEIKLLFDLNEPCVCPESSRGAEPKVLIDLNEPCVSPWSENETLEQQQSLGSTSATEGIPEPELSGPTVNSQRHSTRNRHPTTRALEAVANGYLTVNRRRKRKTRSPDHDETAS